MQDIIAGIIVLFAIIILMVIVCVILYGFVKKRESEDRMLPIERKRAKVLEKQPLSPGTILPLSETQVLFEVEGGKRIWLRAKAQNHLMPGDEGILAWQAGKIISFDRNI